MKTSFHRLALVGALAWGASSLAVASPAPETTAPAPGKPAPGVPSPTGSPSPSTTSPTTGSPGSEAPGSTSPSGTMGSPGSTSRTHDRGLPAADPNAPPRRTDPAVPPSPATVLSERDGPGMAVSPLSGAEAKQAEKVVKELHKTNQLEIALGMLARERTASDAVKEYAKELVEAHSTADRKLLDYASARGVALDLTTAGALPSAHRDVPSPVHNTPSGMGTGAAASPSTTTTGAVGTHGATAGNTGLGASASAGVGANTRPSGAATGTQGSMGVPGSGSGATASDVNLTPPTLDAEGRRIVTRLEKLEGAAFDKAFLTTMVQGHGKTLAKVKSFSNRKLDGELTGLLSDTRSMVENHLQRARELQRSGTASLAPEDGGSAALKRLEP